MNLLCPICPPLNKKSVSISADRCCNKQTKYIAALNLTIRGLSINLNLIKREINSSSTRSINPHKSSPLSKHFQFRQDSPFTANLPAKSDTSKLEAPPAYAALKDKVRVVQIPNEFTAASQKQPSNRAKAWKSLWISKFKKITKIVKYEKDTTDKLLLSYLKERKLNIINKSTFNPFLSNNKVVNYTFNKINTSPSFYFAGGSLMIPNRRIPLNTLYKLLKSFFKSLKSLISYPVLNISPNKLIINLFYYVKPNRAKIKEHKLSQKYIRKDGKLFKDNLLRSKFSKVKHRFNFIFFLNKWKVISNNILLPIINSPVPSKAFPLKDLAQVPVSEKGLSLQEKLQVMEQKELNIWLDTFLRLQSIMSLFINLKTYKINLIKQETESNAIVSPKLNISVAKIKERGEGDTKLKEDGTPPIILEDPCFEKQIWKSPSRALNNLQFNKGLDLEGIIELKLENLETLLSLKDQRKNIFLISLVKLSEKLLSLKFNSLKFKTNNDPSSAFNHSENVQQSFSMMKGVIQAGEFTFKTLTSKDRKEILGYLRSLHTGEGLNDLITLLKEQEYEFLERPIISHNSNPYANKNIILLIIKALHEVYRTSLRLSFTISRSELDVNSVACVAPHRCNSERPNLSPLFKEKEKGGEEQPLYLSFNKFTLPSRPSRFTANNKNTALSASAEGVTKNKSISLFLLRKNEFNSINAHLENLNSRKGFESILAAPNNQINSGGVSHPIFNLINFNHPVTSLSKHVISTLQNTQGLRNTVVSLNLNKFKYLIYFLEKLYNKPIELNLIRLKYPYHESNILAQVLALSSKRYKFFLIMRKLLYTASIKHPGKVSEVKKYTFKTIPSYLSGIKVRLSGRLLTERIVPRQTVKTFQVGSLARGKVNLKSTSRITLKNKRGAYSFTVTTSHILAKSR